MADPVTDSSTRLARILAMAAVVFVVLLLVFALWNQSDRNDGPLERVGEDIEEAGDEIEDAVEDIGDR
jgi:hypothetical protein